MLELHTPNYSVRPESGVLFLNMHLLRMTAVEIKRINFMCWYDILVKVGIQTAAQDSLGGYSDGRLSPHLLLL